MGSILGSGDVEVEWVSLVLGGRVRTVFFGSPEFAVPTLRALCEAPASEVALVVTQARKGLSPVEQAAAELGLPVYKPGTLRDEASRQPIDAVAADLFVVAAFGLIFGPRTLAMPRFGSVNVHPSLLPRYRGASPIPAAIASGDTRTGVSLMVMEAGLDSGPVISAETADIASDDTTESLGGRLASIGAVQVVRDIPRWVGGELASVPQPAVGASLTRPLTKGDGWLDWARPAAELERQVRAMWPWPRAWTTVDGALLQVHRAELAGDDVSGRIPGEVVPSRRRIVVATGRGALELVTVEPAGRRAMPAGAYLNGRRAPVRRFGDAGAPAAVSPLVVPIVAAGTGEGA